MTSKKWLDTAAFPDRGAMADTDLLPVADMTQAVGSRQRTVTAAALRAYVAQSLAAGGAAVEAADPGVGDDDEDGFSVGSLWFNSVSGSLFVCVDASTGAADWDEIAGGGGGVGPETVFTDSDVSGSYEIDLADGTVHDLTLTDDTTFTLAGGLATPNVSQITLYLRPGGHAVTWPTITWEPGAAPSLAGSLVVVVLTSFDAWTTVYGFHAQATPFASGEEIEYAEITSAVSVTATTEAGATTIVTADVVVLDGSTSILVEFFAELVRADNTASVRHVALYLFDGSTSLGRIGFFRGQQFSATGLSWTASAAAPMLLRRRLTPSAGSHTYSVRAAVDAGTGSVNAGAGGSGTGVPAYIRITAA